LIKKLENSNLNLPKKNSCCITYIDETVSSKIGENNMNNNKLRRHTLSPASARAHMYEAIEGETDEDCTKVSNSTDDIVVAELGRELDNILANMDDVPITCDNDVNYLAETINNSNDSYKYNCTNRN
jgi:hypothetical protein